MTRNHHALAGRLTVRAVDRTGRTRMRLEQRNEIVDSGRTLIGRLLVGATTAVPISHLAVGTDATEPAAGDTGLGAEIDTVVRSAIEVEPLSEEIGLRIRGQVSSTTALTVSEAGLFNAKDHDTGDMYNRVAFPSPLPVGPDLDLIFEWDVTF